MADPVLLSAADGPILTLTLNRPDRRNALDLALCVALTAALDGAEADPAVRAVILTGAGGAFSAGADLKEFEGQPEDLPERRERSELMARLFTLPGEMATPVIAAVDGFALGGGCALALGCDMAVASDRSAFGYPEIRFGMVPAGVVPPLQALVGRRAAFDLIATGRRVPAEEALGLGLVQKVVPADRLRDEALAVARSLAENDPAAVAVAKRLVRALDAAADAQETEQAVARARAAGAR